MGHLQSTHSHYSLCCWQLLKSEKTTGGSVSITLTPRSSLTFHSSAPSTWLPPLSGSANFTIFNTFFGIRSVAHRITASFYYQKEASAQSVFTGKRYATLKYLSHTAKLFTFTPGNMFPHEIFIWICFFKKPHRDALILSVYFAISRRYNTSMLFALLAALHSSQANFTPSLRARHKLLWRWDPTPFS